LDKISVERGKETAKNFVRTFKDDSTETQVNITIKMNPLNIDKWRNKFGKDGVSELENRLKLTSALGITNMHMFNENGKMQKFSSINEIINQWFSFRGAIYVKRRDYMLKKLQKDLDIIKYKVEFIEEIINDTIHIKNVKKKLIMTQLDEHKYPKIKIRDDSPASYDYLMSMDLYKLTEEEIIELKKRREIKQTEFETLNNTSATDLWETDLDNFMKLYSKDLDSYDREHEGLIVVKKKRVMKKKNK
jgi:DNA topoisomerase-2